MGILHLLKLSKRRKLNTGQPPPPAPEIQLSLNSDITYADPSPGDDYGVITIPAASEVLVTPINADTFSNKTVALRVYKNGLFLTSIPVTSGSTWSLPTFGTYSYEFGVEVTIDEKPVTNSIISQSSTTVDGIQDVVLGDNSALFVYVDDETRYGSLQLPAAQDIVYTFNRPYVSDEAGSAFIRRLGTPWTQSVPLNATTGKSVNLDSPGDYTVELVFNLQFDNGDGSTTTFPAESILVKEFTLEPLPPEPTIVSPPVWNDVPEHKYGRIEFPAVATAIDPGYDGVIVEQRTEWRIIDAATVTYLDVVGPSSGPLSYVPSYAGDYYLVPLIGYRYEGEPEGTWDEFLLNAATVTVDEFVDPTVTLYGRPYWEQSAGNPYGKLMFPPAMLLSSNHKVYRQYVRWYVSVDGVDSSSLRTTGPDEPALEEDEETVLPEAATYTFEARARVEYTFDLGNVLTPLIESIPIAIVVSEPAQSEVPLMTAATDQGYTAEWSSESNADYQGYYAFDKDFGNYREGWSTANEPLPQWLSITLPVAKTIRCFRLWALGDQNANYPPLRPHTFGIQARNSNIEAWTTIGSYTNLTWQVVPDADKFTNVYFSTDFTQDGDTVDALVYHGEIETPGEYLIYRIIVIACGVDGLGTRVSVPELVLLEEQNVVQEQDLTISPWPPGQSPTDPLSTWVVQNFSGESSGTAAFINGTINPDESITLQYQSGFAQLWSDPFYPTTEYISRMTISADPATAPSGGTRVLGLLTVNAATNADVANFQAHFNLGVIRYLDGNGLWVDLPVSPSVLSTPHILEIHQFGNPSKVVYTLYDASENTVSTSGVRDAFRAVDAGGIQSRNIFAGGTPAIDFTLYGLNSEAVD